jgi:hypothetical protein
MLIISDTDFLSSFLKIERLELVKDLSSFSCQKAGAFRFRKFGKEMV